MLSFHSDSNIKEKYLFRVKNHFEEDEIIKSKYWENGKGCAVGCTIHGSDHAKYESELGIPKWLARVEDTIFVGNYEDTHIKLKSSLKDDTNESLAESISWRKSNIKKINRINLEEKTFEEI